MDLASYIRIQMKSKNLNGIELSQKSGVDNSTISKILNSRTLYPEYESLNALAHALDVNVQSLLDLMPKKFQDRLSQKSDTTIAHFQTIPIFRLDIANQIDKTNLNVLKKEAIQLSYTRIEGSYLFGIIMEDDVYPFLKHYMLTVDPSMPIQEGQYVLVRTASPRATLGRVEFFQHALYVRSLDSQKNTHWKELVQDTEEALIIGVIREVLWSMDAPSLLESRAL